jgi:riboflavin kinase/FMN adenylyltransferase
MAAANIGNRPTFNCKIVTVEAYLLDFDRDIYGEHVIFEVIAFLRPELKYNNVEDLVAQIRRDVAVSRALLEKQPRPQMP